MSIFERSEMLLGESALAKLADSHVAVFGVGGVGGYVIEALVRGGIGHITIVDKDVVEESNINRQIIADTETIGKSKVDVMAERIHKINPDCEVTALNMFYLPETADEIDLKKFDYIVDAIDTVTAKLELISRAQADGVKIISSMGTGGKLDATAFKVGDIYETKGDGLAKVMRKECRKRNIAKLQVVYSEEESKAPGSSVSFVPPVAGLIMAGEVIKDIGK